MAPVLRIRKLVTHVEEVLREQGRDIAAGHRTALAAAILHNPFAGTYQEDLSDLYAMGAELGTVLCRSATDALGVESRAIQSYGKAGIAGVAGELEHVAAVLHPLLGRAVRNQLPQAKAIMPSTTKRAGAGARIDVPLHSVADMWSFDHFDACSLAVEDAPQPDELLIVVGLSTAGRPLARVRSV